MNFLATYIYITTTSFVAYKRRKCVYEARICTLLYKLILFGCNKELYIIPYSTMFFVYLPRDALNRKSETFFGCAIALFDAMTIDWGGCKHHPVLVTGEMFLARQTLKKNINGFHV